MGAHINKDGLFQSDKYPTCPAGKVPFSIKDKTAQDLIWAYAQRRRKVDADFSEDVEICLKKEGFDPRQQIRVDGWRIIDTDNFGGDYPNERWVAIGIVDEGVANIIADALNRATGADLGGARFYKVVAADYVLQPGFEP